MDRKRNSLLNDFKQICSQRSDGYWELLSTAADYEPSVKKTLAGLATQELRYGTSIANTPVMAEERVLALSVSQPAAVRKLFDEWQNLYDKEEITQGDAWLMRAWGQAKRYFSPEDECNPMDKPWSWYEEFTPFSQNGRLLTRRPLREKYLTNQDIQAAISQGPGILRALRTQQVKIEEATFFYYSNEIESLDPYILALLIEFSRKNNFDQNIWIENFLEIIFNKNNPLELTPSIYCLLNPTWCVP
ncbi:hypothetical protein [Oscillatoria acuminata]|uniref:Uncharacterized protein n=1 Tax=Oscillatoria acuminata PCC 6304 TaxID=56110 RepID=K9TJL1_9CYAN|nr:hypothetical protein [Oscillatoria acuminata]AFY83042.1 hypothetical protein Oscil6304_3475 [Oscillatoria acuminata PCC 6304]